MKNRKNRLTYIKRFFSLNVMFVYFLWIFVKLFVWEHKRWISA